MLITLYTNTRSLKIEHFKSFVDSFLLASSHLNLLLVQNQQAEFFKDTLTWQGTQVFDKGCLNNDAFELMATLYLFQLLVVIFRFYMHSSQQYPYFGCQCLKSESNPLQSIFTSITLISLRKIFAFPAGHGFIVI